MSRSAGAPAEISRASDATTIQQALAAARRSIDAVDARVLLRHALGESNEFLATHPTRVLSAEQAKFFHTLVARRAAGEPVAYLTGSREFYGLAFEVNPAVLIPRPETELLVDLALQRLSADGVTTVLDLGTGSGAIAIAIAQHRPLATLYAVDASKAALLVARRNARRLLPQERARQIIFLHGNWYQPLAGRRVDLIVANPPYIAAADPHLKQGDLRFEPVRALSAGTDGLTGLREIIANGASHLEPGGWLICEHGYDQADAVEALFAAARFRLIARREDGAGIPRVAMGQR